HLGYLNIPAEGFREVTSKCVRGSGFAMSYEYALWCEVARAKPLHHFRVVGVCRKALKLANSSPHGHVLSMNLYFVRTVDERATARSCSLVPNEQDVVSFFGQETAEVMEHATAGGHSACGDH